MVEKRHQVFVSSTYEDLKQERDRILRTLAENGYIAAGMEFFPAIDEEQFKFIKTILDQSDYCVCLVAGKYGSLASDGVGYSEKEHDYAVEQKIPVIALLREDIEALPDWKREVDSNKIELLNRFRRKLGASRLVRSWKGEMDLCLQLVNSLAVTGKKYPRPGWIRGTEDPEELLRKIMALEETNNRLQQELAAHSQISVAELIRKRLLERRVAITYKYEEKKVDTIAATEGDGPRLTERTEEYSMYQIAEFLLPRLKSEASPAGFSGLICDAITALSPNKAIEIQSAQVEAIETALDELGLINITTREIFDRVRKSIVTTYLGLEVAKEENTRLKRLARLRPTPPPRLPYTPPTFGKVMGEALDLLIDGTGKAFRWMLWKLVDVITRVIRRCRGSPGT